MKIAHRNLDPTEAPKKPIRIVEFIGPAGSGKSTLGHYLKQYNRVKLIFETPYFRNVKDIPFFVRYSLLSLPTLVQFYRHRDGEHISRRQVAYLVALRGWPDRVRRYIREQDTIYFLDEGPLFLMAYVRAVGPAIWRSPHAEKWWQSRCRHYAEVVDMLVWLDAPDDILIDRVRSREIPHGIKTESLDYAYNLLNNTRQAFDILVPSMIKAVPELKVLHFDSTKETADQISSKIMAQIDL